MKVRDIITIILCALLATACGAARIVTGQNSRRDSVRVEYRTERIERIDTVYIELPQAAERTVTRDTVSRLENDLAVSEAAIDTEGFLHHSLETKRRKVPVPVTATVERRDSIIYRDRDVYVERPVEVVRPLSKFVKGQIIGFWVLLTAAVLCIIIKIKKL